MLSLLFVAEELAGQICRTFLYICRGKLYKFFREKNNGKSWANFRLATNLSAPLSVSSSVEEEEGIQR